MSQQEFLDCVKKGNIALILIPLEIDHRMNPLKISEYSVRFVGEKITCRQINTTIYFQQYHVICIKNLYAFHNLTTECHFHALHRYFSVRIKWLLALTTSSFKCLSWLILEANAPFSQDKGNDNFQLPGWKCW